MISCPKCGFVQPKDRFCANCGVDMEKYQLRMAPVPWYERLAGSYIMQTLLILGIVVFTSVAIYRKKRADIVGKLPSLVQPLQITKPKTLEPQPVPPAPPPQPVSEPTPTVVRQQPLRVKEEPQPALEEEAKPVATPTLHVFLAEASVSYLNRMGDLRPLGGQGTTGGAIVSNLESRLQNGRSTQEVRAIAEKRLPVRIGQVAHSKKTAVDEANAPLGLGVELRPTSVDERGLHFQLTVTRTLRESNETPPQPYRYSETITLANDSGVFIYGLLPRRKPYASENLLPEDLHDVMSSPEFLSGAFDLVLFVEGKGLPVAPAR